jgi:hypothetical protein
MDIFIEQPNRTKQHNLFIGEKSRLSTMTSVCFTKKNHLISAHYSGAKMLNIECHFQQKTHQIMGDVDTTFDSKLTVTDLIDFDGNNRLLTSNFDARSGSLYGLKGTELYHIKDFPLPQDGGNCHGARFYDANTICLSTNKHFLFFIDIESSLIVAKVPTPYFLKDVCFIDSNKILAPFAVRSPSKNQQPTYSSGLLYASIDLTNSRCTIINKIFFMPAAFDAICYEQHRGMFYITDQGRDRIIAAKINNNKIQIAGEYKGFDFPHGIDVKENMIVYTNYGNSMIGFKNTDTEQLFPISGLTSRWRPYTRQELKIIAKYYLRRILQRIGLKKR